jgi:hypothetical protein
MGLPFPEPPAYAPFKRSGTGRARGATMSETGDGIPDEQKQNRVIAEIVELQREYYFENRSKETERRRRLRDIIERATPLSGR